ncbi:bifunctional serine/threonine-protein kinase/ABC transporter substrate-binding protein [Streptomyces cadmiisoli]|uniref:Serine/threonine protein kinase n=1 Tax=Streptomyces cadmiisoli TaxID=2184053 RepID=A0A2Z4J194_9ACTN|nr:bifunctional serine/threonine-protein kinase/ABC transporter substrate-binding protein [Streptomyces cadmiisoli]AWW38754.1 serine/threonine protein kinase [Streptomyces cadmiisoli]
MRALRAEDPETLGGHRLLARLGAGGMGVVYLARTESGALLALKVIRAEYAADPAFRARFRREARLATGLTGRWVVPVTAADPEAREPWLATAFVPGPSLAEAVDGHGPLSGHGVAVLGARLARALAEVHAAGLVHRDVKPGNILLALDGPRLIDFGIAQGTHSTALTAPDAVVGTPGFLSPEQARADADEVGPPGDVFSLGCVLAYAATGTRPFGTGGPAAVLYRTVHEEPDLAGLDRLPPPMRTAVRECLAKEPGRRPTAAALRQVLEAVAAGPGHGASGDGDWLPPAVLRVVAERSARALDPPPRSAPSAAPEFSGGDDSAAARPSRRRVFALAGSTAAVLAASGAGAAVLLARRNAAAGGSEGGAPPTRTIGFQADLTGPGKASGRAQERGARLAVAALNSRADARFRLVLKVEDDGGRAAGARESARRLTADRTVVAVVGPTATAAARAAAPVYEKASLALLLVSVDADTAWPSNKPRVVCPTTLLGRERQLPVLDYLTRVSRTRRTAVVEDRAAGDTAWDLARDLRATPPNWDIGGTVTVHPAAVDGNGPRGAADAALAARAQAVVYAGTSPDRAAACARALTAAGFDGPRLGFEPAMRPAFLTAAGEAAEGWLFEAPYTEPEAARTGAAEAFTAVHRARYGADPGRWAAEAYDAVGLVARTLDALGAGSGIERGQVSERVFRVVHDGVAKTLRFRSERTLESENAGFLYQVAGGSFRFLGRHDQVRAEDG